MSDPRMAPQVSVVMPTFEQSAFIARAIASLASQSFPDWELIVVDDGSEDDTAKVVGELLTDRRISYYRHDANRGLGAALNTGLDLAAASLIAYLPSDDVYHSEHLGSLASCLHDEHVLVYAGVRYGEEETLREPAGFGLQLVQAMHRRTGDRWVERGELESDDLERLFWHKLRARGGVSGSGRVTCEWVQRPQQRHRLMRESFDGGLNVFRSHYRVATPLRFHSRDSWPVDEGALYARFRDLSAPGSDGLKILLVGELAYNPERVLAFEERGHRLFGLWTTEGLGMNSVGPLPFGHVEDLPRRDWRDSVERIRPDLIYALLNWRAVPVAHEVLSAGLSIPFVWHFKESPMRCMARGTWPQLVGLCTRSDARVYSTPLEKEWFDAALGGRIGGSPAIVLDGDLPKAEWFDGDRVPRLSSRDGALHTVVLGRPLGIDRDVVRALASADIHLHLYGLRRERGPGGEWSTWLDDARRVAPGYVHVHPHLDQRKWVSELSRYDAGWLHRFTSSNGGDLMRATWDDLNYPARLATLMAAGVPVLQQQSRDGRVAVEELVRELDIGILYRDVDDLCARLHDEAALERRRQAVWEVRHRFTFDHHVDRLVDLFHSVIA